MKQLQLCILLSKLYYLEMYIPKLPHLETEAMKVVIRKKYF